MANLIDTHCHLDYLKPEELSHVLSGLEGSDVKSVITIGVSLDNQKIISEIAHIDPRIYFTQGLHPHHASDFNDDFLSEIKTRVENPKCVAIGEIGLDYYYLKSTKEEQRFAFEAQLQFAIDHNMPICIHTRDAEDDTIAVLNQFKDKLAGKILIHSFTGTEKLSNFILQNDYFLSVNGIITFKNAKNITDIIKNFPLENILLETDSPYLAPMPHRGKTNTSLFLQHVADGLSKIKEMDREIIADQVQKNTYKFFPKIQNQ
ncbi:MAG: TatD family hydrolase [Bacteriovoracaceae bacterium]|nr:TatD family hydrolase [Bacteriovoracaceae bacterium]